VHPKWGHAITGWCCDAIAKRAHDAWVVRAKRILWFVSRTQRLGIADSFFTPHGTLIPRQDLANRLGREDEWPSWRSRLTLP
jgi:hypothetical protein